MHQLWVEKRMRELSSQRFKSGTSKIKTSKVERQEEMAYVSVGLLNETPLQNSTASIGDMPNVEVEENEINIGTVEHEMRQEGELGMENEVVCVTEAIVNVEGIDVATRKEGVRHVNAEKGLVLKRLR